MVLFLSWWSAGAHTIGMARCENFRARIYGDFQGTSGNNPVSNTYLSNLKSICPATGGGEDNTAGMDYVTPNYFDNSFYHLLLKGEGLLNSDQELYSSLFGIQTKGLVKKYAEDSLAFFQQFSDSMVKLGNITNADSFSTGEVRKNCRFVNTWALATTNLYLFAIAYTKKWKSHLLLYQEVKITSQIWYVEATEIDFPLIHFRSILMLIQLKKKGVSS